MRQVKVVIGANFGDEGKGLMTDYFCSQAEKKKEKRIVICHNGGAQRGHTVTTPEGIRHVFHHFGSGVFAGADTYLSRDFILNPMIFREEREELKRKGYSPKIYLHPDCLVTTPFDMILNQIIEEHRSFHRHGSCGAGIFETIKRNQTGTKTLAKDSIFLEDRQKKELLCKVREEDFLHRLNELDIELDDQWKAIVFRTDLIQNYLEDLRYFMQNTEIAEEIMLNDYSSVIVENGQGLLLDQENKEYFPHLTPSNTGLKNPAKQIQRRFSDADVEVCYVTRPYLTRHGAGRMDNECPKEEIGSAIEDRTNVPNPYQGTLRYGKINVGELKKRIIEDFEKEGGKEKNWKLSLAVTHRNEVLTDFWAVQPWEEGEFFPAFSYLYFSDGEDRNHVQQKRRKNGIYKRSICPV